ncbi:hypothetical protein [Streptomyces sp. NPDC051546]|uniref:hypothetical protein n=1 Tax=Streptomyces sp. NPDC051546 TaxID=3365655 RepID=UPI0037AE1BC2
MAAGVPAYAANSAREAASASEYVDVQLLSIADLHGYLQKAPAVSSVIYGN